MLPIIEVQDELAQETLMSDARPANSPGDYIRKEMDLRGWTQADLAQILGRPLPTVNRILQGKHQILPEMAIALGGAFDTGAEIWLQRESEYRLALAEMDFDVSAIEKRARLHLLAPIKEMVRREWIRSTNSSDELEAELRQFFGVETLDHDSLRVSAVTRRTSTHVPINPSQRAWCFRVRQLASAQIVGEYNADRLDECKKQLRKLAAYPQETHKVPRVLESFGIRFVIVEPLPGTRVDGAAMWINESPAIGMSCRFDRFDSFWFTLGHELTHIENRDEAPVDSDLSATNAKEDIEALGHMKPEMERLADEGAAAMLIPPHELESFIRRVGPLYSKDRIIKFAHRIKIHPAIIVGQLQSRGEIGYHANREMLSKVRQFLLPAAITDGWGHSIDPRNLG